MVGSGIRRAKEPILGEPRTDAELFEAIYPALRRLAAAVRPPECDPDDLVQDAVARALRTGSLLRLDEPLAYLRRTIINLASNERRRLQRMRRAVARQPAPGVVPVDHRFEVGTLLRLSPADRAVLWLADIECLAFVDVADALGCSPDAARARASRARERLRRLLEDDDR